MTPQIGALKVPLVAATTAAVGGVLKLVNPEGVDLLITRLILNITTKSTGAATVDIGVDTDGTTSKDTLIDGLDVNAAAGVFDNVQNKGTNGKPALKWGATEYIVASASATVAGLVGYAYIEYCRV